MTSTPQPPTGSYPPPTVKPDLTLAWLAHLLVFFTGFIGPLVIWQVKKDTDKVAAYHAKQAFYFAVSIIVLMLLFSLVLNSVVLMLETWGVGIASTVYIILAIIETAQGKPFKYIFVANKYCKKEFAEAYPDLASPVAPPPPAAPGAP